MDEKAKFLLLLGDNIRKYRTLKSFSQEELSLRVEVAKSTIQRIESGKLNPTIWTLKNIASILEVDIDDLVK